MVAEWERCYVWAESPGQHLLKPIVPLIEAETTTIGLTLFRRLLQKALCTGTMSNTLSSETEGADLAVKRTGDFSTEDRQQFRASSEATRRQDHSDKETETSSDKSHIGLNIQRSDNTTWCGWPTKNCSDWSKATAAPRVDEYRAAGPSRRSEAMESSWRQGHGGQSMDCKDLHAAVRRTKEQWLTFPRSNRPQGDH